MERDRERHRGRERERKTDRDEDIVLEGIVNFLKPLIYSYTLIVFSTENNMHL